jgi:opacity protein-like surface antigen
LKTTPNQAGIDCGAEGFNIQSESSTSFAYEFGGGMSYAVLEDVSISLEYLYTGFNDVALGDYHDSDLVIEGSDVNINTQSMLSPG